jgi:hypothetical protein
VFRGKGREGNSADLAREAAKALTGLAHAFPGERMEASKDEAVS